MVMGGIVQLIGESGNDKNHSQLSDKSGDTSFIRSAFECSSYLSRASDRTQISSIETFINASEMELS